MRTAREQLGTRRSDDEERHVGRPVDEGIDEVEQAVVGPVEILEDEHGRALRGKALEEAAPGRECLDAPVPAGGVVGDTDEWAATSFATSSTSCSPHTRATVSRSFDSATGAASLSRIPASALTISPSAQ